MIIDICRGCNKPVWEYNLQIASELIKAKKKQGFRIIHGWWDRGCNCWMDCTK